MVPADTVIVEVCGPLHPDDIPALCARVQALLAADHGVICALRGTADLGVVDALTRLHLMAGRLGAWLRVQATGTDLAELLALTGLENAVPEEL